ncbi:MULTISPECIES: hypothetical protein [Brevibacillus]|uniref:Uncharacterized protein n=1 Tax=Brevibacillus brevis TaxID=1393 RepID=A0A2Z4MG16_BREBE|nr:MULTISPECIES: hypothetical protein [Brevibacillus]AWX55398.1 hypothetical protein AB432_010265 [Brevibacillus brevis]NRR20644.1 hypothetical protein [Brevibacillus sp. MS2.2]
MKKVMSGLLTLVLLSSLIPVASAKESPALDNFNASATYPDIEPDNNKLSGAGLYAIGGQINGFQDDQSTDYYKVTPPRSGTVRFEFVYARGTKGSGVGYQDFWLRLNANGSYNANVANYDNKFFDVYLEANKTYNLRVDTIISNDNLPDEYYVYSRYLD